MNLEVGGKGYEISGVLFGTLPVWKLITSGGKPLTEEDWEALPPAHQQTLAVAVHKHIDGLG